MQFICPAHFHKPFNQSDTIFQWFFYEIVVEMMKLAILMCFVAAAAAGAIPQAVESMPTDMEGAATHHHGFYERNIGLYAGALPAVYPGGYGGGYPAASPYYPRAYPGYSSGYVGGYG